MIARTRLSRFLPAAFLLAILVLAVAGCSSDQAADAEPSPSPAQETPLDAWMMLGHDISASFHNPAEAGLSVANVGQLREAWTFTTGGSVTGTPAVVDGRVYALAAGAIYALDAATGGLIWENSAIGGTSSPTFSDGTLYVTDSRSVLYALDAETGDEQWQALIDPHPHAAGFSSPLVVADYLIVGSASSEEAVATDNATFRGSVVAFDRTTGTELWRHYTADPPFNGVAVWSTVSVDTEAGLVFATTGNNYTGAASETSDSIFALALETGEVIWNTQLSKGDVFTIPNPRSEDTDFGTNPILFEAPVDGELRELLGAGQKSGMFWVLDSATGEVVWSRQVSGGSALIGGVFNNGAYDGKRIVVAGNNGTSDGPGSEPANGESEPLGAANTPTSVLMAMDPADGNVLWERQLPAWVWAPITLANGVGFVSAESELQAFDIATGEQLFSFDTDGTIASGAAVAGGRIFFGSGLGYFGTTPGNTIHALALP